MRLSLACTLIAAVSLAALVATRCEFGSAEADVITRAAVPASEAPVLALEGRVAADAEPTLQGRRPRAADAWTPTGVRVHVVALGGQPLPRRHVVARWTRPGDEAETRDHGTTNEVGDAFLTDVPHDGTARVTVWTGDEPPDVRPDDPVVTGPVLVVRLDALLEARLLCLDAESGLEAERGPHGVWFDGATCGNLVVAPRGRLSNCGPLVAAPSGYVAWDETEWTVAVGRWTRVLEAVYPLRREACVHVKVLDHAGHPAPDATIEHFAVAGRGSPHQVEEVVGPGRFRLRGVPYLRGEPLVVRVTADGLRYPIEENVSLPFHPADRTDLQVVLPVPGTQAERENAVIGIGGGSSSRFCCGRGSHRRGGLELRVVRHDGTPASGATVKVGSRTCTLDDRGVYRDSAFPVGRWIVRTGTLGLLPVSGQVVVREGETASLLLREPRGGALDVRVVDAEDRPVSCAELHVRTPSGAPWVDEHDGVQRIDPFTDHLGRRRLDRVETGRVEVRARWATRRAKAEVDVREDDVSRVTLVVR